MALDALAGVQVVGECSGGAEAVEVIRRESPDLVFLDISMPEVDGFEVVEAVGLDRLPNLVFVTAHDDAALRAFDVAAVDYVLKPFDDERIAAAVDRVRVRDRRVRGAADTMSRFLVRDEHRAFFVRASEVDWIQADGKHVKLHVGDAVYRVRTSLTRVAERLDRNAFARVHRSSIVNLDRIVEVQPWFGGDHIAVLDGGARVRVSRTYRPTLLKTLS